MLKIIGLRALNSISVQQDEGSKHFISSSNSFIIAVPTLSYILLALLKNNIIDEQVLLGILEEYHSERTD